MKNKVTEVKNSMDRLIHREIHQRKESVALKVRDEGCSREQKLNKRQSQKVQ